MLIATEGALFGTLIATYFYLRLRSAEWPPPEVPAPAVALPLALCAVLVASTAPVAFAARAAGRGAARPAWLLIALALLVQGGYLAWQVVLFTNDLARFDPGASAYGSIYFTLLGTHHAHVAVGLLLDAWLLARIAAGGLTPYRARAVRVTALYWAFVAAVGVLVVATQVSAA